MNAQGTAKLQYVLGSTVSGPNSISTSDSSGLLAYMAGSTIVLHNVSTRRVGHLICPNPPLCLCVSPCGSYLAVGECGPSPSVRVFELTTDENGRPEAHPIHNLQHHNADITATRFSPDSSLLVSVGCPQDGQLCVWNWKDGQLAATAKLAAQVNCLMFSPDGSVCVTAGTKHVKYWVMTGIDAAKGVQSRSAILADRRSSVFVDCVFLDHNRLLAVTSDGVVVELANKKYVNTYQWEDLSPTSITATQTAIVLGCSSGSVQLCSRVDLSPLSSLPPPVATSTDPAAYTTIDQLETASQSTCIPAVRSLSCFDSSGSVVSFHDDNSLYIHSPADKDWQRVECQLAHRGPVNTLLCYPSTCSYLPSGSFITGGSDGSLRVWNADGNAQGTSSVPSSNLICSTLKKSIFIGDCSSREPCASIQSTAISSDGRHLVAGTSAGTLHVVDLSEASTPISEVIDAHESQVMCLDYSDERTGYSLLASGGEDQLVHIFSTSSSPYIHCQVIEDHQGSIKALRFAQTSDGLYLYTCSSDNTMIIWKLQENEESIAFTQLHQIPCPSPFNDLSLARNGQSLLAACQDGQIRMYGLDGKIFNSVKSIQQGEAATVTTDPSNTLAVACSSSGGVRVVETKSGQTIASAGADTATRAVVSEDCKRLIVSSTNGCIYIWRVANALVERMTEAKREMLMARSPSPDSLLDSESEATSDLVSSLNDFGSPDFGSSTSLEKISGKPIVLGSANKSPSLLTVHPAQVHRRSNSNLLATPDGAINEDNNSDYDSQSDFISRQRPLPQYQTSKSMLNLRDMQAGGMMTSSPLRPVAERQPRRVRHAWGDNQSPGENDWKQQQQQQHLMAGQPFSLVNGQGQFSASPAHAISHHVMMDYPPSTPTRSSPMVHQNMMSRSPQSQQLTQYQRNNTEGFNLRYDQSPSRIGMSRAGSRPIGGESSQPQPLQSNFRRDSGQRVSLSKRYMDGSEPRKVWTPQTMNPRRTTSNMQSASPTGAAASAINRRQSEQHRVRFGAAPSVAPVPEAPITPKSAPKDLPPRTAVRLRSRTAVVDENDLQRARARRADDYTSSQLHLRSRSQSPNQLMLSQQSTPASRELTRELQRRRDSDMSYTAVSTRMTPATSRGNLRDGETRKSSDTLNKMAAIRSKLHQSSENLRKSSDNLSMAVEGMGSEMGGRTRSISNLRGGLLEAAGTFDADQKPRTPGSLAHSRMLARSMGNVSNADEGGMVDSPGSRLQNTLAMLRKASNPDLTESGQYDDSGSSQGEKMRRRGAVQKKVERFRPHRANRQQTSEESDSNASDASPLNQSINRRLMGNGAYRSVSSVESSPRTGTARRLYEQQRNSNLSTPRRTNYLAQKLAGEEMLGGPDLGSDDSPRSSVNASEWQNLLDDASDCQQLVKHVQDCSDQFQVHTDKLIQARKMVEESSLSADQKRIVTSQIDRVAAQSVEKLTSSLRQHDVSDTNGNDYTPIKGPQIYQVLKQNLSTYRQ